MTVKEKTANIIQDAEKKWLEKSIQFVSQQFNAVFLPSHDVTHHLRTWKNAKAILTELSELNNAVDYSIVEAVLLATMFHDTGMVVSRNPDHGSFSKKSYLEFIHQQGTELPVLQNEILRAIELHDLKDQYVYIPFTYNNPPDILTVTSISDDLDALGVIGIYRYAEIYLHRRISHQSLGIQILKNVSVRFNHLIKASSLLPELVNQNNKQYHEIINFFDEYNQQILVEEELKNIFNRHLGVINYIRQFSVEGKISPDDFLDVLNNFTVGTFVLSYFKNLENAINETNSHDSINYSNT